MKNKTWRQPSIRNWVSAARNALILLGHPARKGWPYFSRRSNTAWVRLHTLREIPWSRMDYGSENDQEGIEITGVSVYEVEIARCGGLEWENLTELMSYEVED